MFVETTRVRLRGLVPIKYSTITPPFSVLGRYIERADLK